MASPISGANVSFAIFNPPYITATETARPTMPSIFQFKYFKARRDKMAALVVITSPMASAAVASITLELILLPSFLLNNDSQNFTPTEIRRISTEIHLKYTSSGWSTFPREVLNRENPT